MNIIVKKSESRVDPKRPETHPGYERAVAVSAKRSQQMTFETDGAKRDYERALARNPNNLPGMPMFYPPLELKSVTGDIWARELTDEEKARMLSENIRLIQIRNIEIYCGTCNAVTRHGINTENSFCCKCGTNKPYHH